MGRPCICCKCNCDMEERSANIMDETDIVTFPASITGSTIETAANEDDGSPFTNKCSNEVSLTNHPPSRAWSHEYETGAIYNGALYVSFPSTYPADLDGSGFTRGAIIDLEFLVSTGVLIPNSWTRFDGFTLGSPVNFALSQYVYGSTPTAIVAGQFFPDPFIPDGESRLIEMRWDQAESQHISRTYDEDPLAYFRWRYSQDYVFNFTSGLYEISGSTDTENTFTPTVVESDVTQLHNELRLLVKQGDQIGYFGAAPSAFATSGIWSRMRISNILNGTVIKPKAIPTVGTDFLGAWENFTLDLTEGADPIYFGLGYFRIAPTPKPSVSAETDYSGGGGPYGADNLTVTFLLDHVVEPWTFTDNFEWDSVCLKIQPYSP
jgi:hypothetical protein